ncbi:hypothetical protein ACIGCM_19955 [Pseudomonas sp. NPDC078700]|uniref:hypothetical protein n=1 Tax=Pseudomonas sp. NPDC078700 TaxID=3364424 RepID=UPI0037C92A6C
MNSPIKCICSALFSLTLLASASAGAATSDKPDSQDKVQTPEPGAQSQTPPTLIKPQIKDQDQNTDNNDGETDNDQTKQPSESNDTDAELD